MQLVVGYCFAGQRGNIAQVRVDNSAPACIVGVKAKISLTARVSPNARTACKLS